ncbi:damage-inducible protein J [Enterococcus faecium]|uniref:damage-inducible protein J n=1 Tax=Enterococcus TaxID=1350 RepID=UPI0009BF0DBF|nr:MULTISPECIES: damage-inducible protein J [Enterococcus]MCI1134676.1 damage-inducible protein J [Enterococcus gallinarum]EGP4969734.1 damage-inducible protein J [Enterococcus faecium]EGP5455952.1 damage-inducible protein J [Enterococcus faecium]EGP5552974.1 damage-inducible protein J [Enterococcus faecium]MBX4243150.1 damage-inducible protein J [Enterococcus lactis]
MEINVEHILDCLDRYGKGELTKEQVNEELTIDEKVFLIMNQDFLETDEEESFFMVVEVNENLCRQAESVLEEIGAEMPDAIESFLKELVETKQLPIVVND